MADADDILARIRGGTPQPSASTGISAEDVLSRVRTAAPTDEKVYYNEAGQPFTLSGKPVPTEAARQEEYRPALLPFSMEGGFHLVTPEVIAAPLRGAYEAGQRLRGIGEEGRDPLRPLSPDELSAVSLFAGPAPAVARGSGLTTSPLSTYMPTAPQRLLKDFEAAGVSPNAPTVGQGRTAGLASQIANTLPITGPVVRGAVTKTLADTAAATERAATRYGAAATPLEAGEAVQRGITGFAQGPAPNSFAVRSRELYSDFDRSMDPKAQIPLTNTLQALGTPMGRFPTSPELGAQLTNPRLRSYAGAIEPTTQNVPALYSSLVDANGQPILLRAAQTLQKGGTLTFDELKELRSTIGRAIGDPILVNDIPKADLKRVYGAISQDLEDGARQRGPEALKAFRRANDYYRAGLDRIEQIEGLLKGSPEQSFAKLNRAAQQGVGADVGLLRSVKKSVPSSDWNNVGAAVIRRLGEPTAGAKDVLADTNFSVSSFSTNWAKISNDAKDALFGADTPGSPRSGLETLSRISQAQKNVGRLANVSRSGEFALTGGLAFSAIEHLARHPDLIGLAPMAAGGAAGYGAAKLLMSPKFARWLYALPATVSKAPSADVAAQRALLSLTGAATRPTPQDRNSPTKGGLPPMPAYTPGVPVSP